MSNSVVGLAERRQCLIGTLPGPGLRGVWKECVGFPIPADQRAAQHGRAQREIPDIAADLGAGFVQAPRLKDVRNGAAAGRDRRVLKQRPSVRIRAVRCAEPFPGMKHTDAGGEEAGVVTFNASRCCS